MKKVVLLLTLLTVFVHWGTAQSTCPNSNFSMNNFTNWTGRTGSCCPINIPTVGIVAGRHTIMTGAGTDINTGNNLPIVCPGYAFSARLGNQNTGAQAEGLSYTINVATDSSNALFLYNYAVVMQDPGHTPAQQPRFELQVRDAFGNIIPCTSYLVSAAANIPGFQSAGSVRWKPWESVGVDLSPYIGQQVTIEMRTGDCSQSGHYGYAYIVAECRPMKLNVTYCYGTNTAVITAPPGFASYQWSDGTNGPSTSVVNPTPGQTLNVILTSVSGCQAQLVARLYQTVINPDFADTAICKSAQFTDLSTAQYGINVQWDWDFGDGTTAPNTQSPSHVFPGGGTYNVQLVVTSDNGCQDSITRVVTIDDVPTAAFTAPQVCGNEWTFLNNSFGNDTITAIDWDFGDNSTSNTADPVHIFPDPNQSGVWNYNVQLIVTNENNCTDTAVVPITIHDIPEADFGFPPVVCKNFAAPFTDSSFVGNENIANWSWDFGNGATAATQNTQHSFASSGIQPVQLIVESTNGCRDTIVQNIDVGEVPVADFPLPDACGVQIVFADSTDDFGQPIVSWAWDFGDGSGSNLQNPQHLFPANGQYNVELIVENSSGCADTVSKLVTAYDKPVADFSFVAACPFNTVNMTDQSTAIYDAITSWTWITSPGNIVNTQNTSDVYNTAGYKPVTLMVSTAFGCSDTITKNVYVYELPKPDFAAAPVCEGFVSQFVNNSQIDTGTIVAYLYNMSDAGLPVNQNAAPGVVVPAWGTYNIQLVAVSNNGCVDSITKTITVYPNPQAQFTVFPDNGCSPLQVNYADQSTIPQGSIVMHDWDLDLGYSNVQNPTFTYGTGLYDISLTVTSDRGCKDSVEVLNAVTVHPDPVAFFDPNPNSNSVIEPYFQFDNQSTGYTSSFWTFGDGTSSTDQSPFHIYPNDVVGSYDVSLVVTNQFGCIDSISNRVYVYDDHVIYIPNTLTQNADGVNETLTIYGTNIVNAELVVFNRWGEKVGHVKGWQLDRLSWDGNGSNGKPLKQDTYAYKLFYSVTSGKDFERVGHVNILR